MMTTMTNWTEKIHQMRYSPINENIDTGDWTEEFVEPTLTVIDEGVSDNESPIEGTSVHPNTGDQHEIVDKNQPDVDNNDDDESVNQRYNLRTCRNTNYRNLHRYGEVQLLQLQKNWLSEDKNCNESKCTKLKGNDLYRRIINTTFTQLAKDDKYAQVSVTEGIRRHGEKAIMAVLSEYAQLDDKKVFSACDVNKLNAGEKRKALNLITMVKEKRDGKIKGRACADGRKQ